MATNRQDALKEGTLEGAADRLARMRENTLREAVDREPLPDPENDMSDLVEEVEELEVHGPEELGEPESEPAQEVAPSDEDDLFADDLDEAVEERTLDAPAALSKEGKELFSQADPALQEEIAARLKAAERGATQKVQQATEKEKEVEAIAEQVLKLREEYEQRLKSFEPTLPEPPDPDLADINSDNYDPDQFNVQLARYERAKMQVEKAKSERQKLDEENVRRDQQRSRQELESNAQRIVQYFPAWSTQEKFTAGVRDVHQWLVKEGIDPKVASQVTNAEMIKIAYKAKRYDEIKSQVRTKSAPKVSAPTKRSSNKTTTNISKVRQSLKETGSLEDAVAVLKSTRRKR